MYNGNAPSRMNPRIPIKRANIHGDEGNEDANLESYDTDKFLATETGDHDDGAAGEDDNSSLWIDPRKTPMDRIQVFSVLLSQCHHTFSKLKNRKF